MLTLDDIEEKQRSLKAEIAKLEERLEPPPKDELEHYRLDLALQNMKQSVEVLESWKNT